MKKIEMFVPYHFERKKLDEEQVRKYFNSNKVFYVSKGRYAIIHILKSYGIFNGVIGISSYMCPSVGNTLIQKGYEVVYYDIDVRDLNPDLNSIHNLINKKCPRAIVIASMYGNPANLAKIEELCKEKKAIMIDDAAQAFGAQLDRRNVGSFGDGVFFSFSPGKPTAAHRGGFFWTNNEYSIKRTHHLLNAVVCYNNFKYQRYLAYSNVLIRRKFWSILAKVFLKLHISVEYDEMEPFENEILGGVFDVSLKNATDYREKWIDVFSHIEVKGCRLIKRIRGEKSNCCKIIYLFDDVKQKTEFEKYLDVKQIVSYGGYRVPTEITDCNNAKYIADRIIELPIDPNNEKMEYLYNCVKNYFNNHCKEALYS